MWRRARNSHALFVSVNAQYYSTNSRVNGYYSGTYYSPPANYERATYTMNPSPLSAFEWLNNVTFSYVKVSSFSFKEPGCERVKRHQQLPYMISYSMQTASGTLPRPPSVIDAGQPHVLVNVSSIPEYMISALGTVYWLYPHKTSDERAPLAAFAVRYTHWQKAWTDFLGWKFPAVPPSTFVNFTSVDQIVPYQIAPYVASLCDAREPFLGKPAPHAADAATPLDPLNNVDPPIALQTAAQVCGYSAGDGCDPRFDLPCCASDTACLRHTSTCNGTVAALHRCGVLQPDVIDGDAGVGAEEVVSEGDECVDCVK